MWLKERGGTSATDRSSIGRPVAGRRCFVSGTWSTTSALRKPRTGWAWCATGGDGIVGEWSRAELEEHLRDEHSTFTWLLEPMIERAGFTVEEARRGC